MMATLACMGSRLRGNDGITRVEVVRLARAWVGTPYHHQASVRGVGADCLGLVRGVWRELYGFEAEIVPGYSRDWAEASGVETMLDGARRQMVEVRTSEAEPGDVVVFRLRPQTVAKHAAILVGTDRMIHAMEGGPASEVSIGPWWRRRIAGVFRFADVNGQGGVASVPASRDDGGMVSARARCPISASR